MSNSTAVKKTAPKFTTAERAAMRERARELKAAAEGAEAAAAVNAKIAELKGSERDLAERIHALITTAAPELSPRLWYGMPAYAKDGKIVCFYKTASKFGSRYATLGFSDPANLDDGAILPTEYAITEKLGAADERRLAELVKRAVS